VDKALSAAPHKLQQWRTRLTLALLGVLALPGVFTWLAVLGQRSFSENIPQLITVAFLLAAVRKAKSSLQACHDLTANPYGLALTALSGTLYVLGICLSIKVVIFVGLLATAAALYWTCFGSARFYRSLPAFLFALFLLPQFPTDLRTAISLPLQLISTQLATGLAALFIPIQTQGNIFYVKGEAFEVTAACSGLNTWVGYLFAGMLALLMGRFTLARLGRLLIAAPLLALGQNAIRLWITAMVAYWVSAQAGTDIHTNLEFLLFPLGLLVMVFGEKLFSGKQRGPTLEECPTAPENPALTADSATEATATPQTLPAQPAESPTESTEEADSPPIESPCAETSRPASTRLGWALLILVALLNLGVWLGGGFLQKTLNSSHSEVAQQTESRLPPVPYQVGPWHGKDEPLRNNEVAILAPATLISREYSIGDAQTGQPQLWMNLLETPAMNALHNMVDSLIASGAKPKLMGTVIIQTRKGPLKASWFRCEEPDGRPYQLLLWYEWAGGNAENRWAWYWNVLQAKLQQRQPVWRLVELASPGSPADAQPEQARRLEQLKSFAAEIYPASIP